MRNKELAAVRRAGRRYGAANRARQGELKTGVILMAADGERTGLAAALALLGAQGELAGGGETADMFDAGEAAALPLASKGVSGPRGGRPLGARNRSTEEWARFLLSQYRSPLVVLAELYSRPAGEVVDELQAMADRHKKWRETKDGGYWTGVQIDPLAVLKLQKEAAVALAEYVHKKQPKAIEVKDSKRGMVLLGDFEDVGAAGDDDLALPLAGTEEKQGVGAARGTEVGQTQSDGRQNQRQDKALERDAG